eukprot:TRINITY_DN64646_c0_g1_i1.p1 TRINITY_DN64646_c0_g1~~TRINITY_DN64646_c0_g1_i1.p1  ORF type:complete len:365 (+),score=40.52 TRINITY_DN64646_c0_g1_i1:120-1214(+)
MSFLMPWTVCQSQKTSIDLDSYEDCLEASPRKERNLRPLTLALLKLSERRGELAWHWALGVGEEFYEVGSSSGKDKPMTVLGPEGAVAWSGDSEPSEVSYRREQFSGTINLERGTRKSDEQMHDFINWWVSKHPSYNILGPNCQYFVADFYHFLTGEELPFRKDTDKIRNALQVMIVPWSFMAEKWPDEHLRRKIHKYDLPNMSCKVEWHDRGNDSVLVGASISRVAFKSLDGLFISADFHHGPLGYFGFRSPVFRLADEWCEWETFFIVQRPEDHFCYIQTHHETWLSCSETGVLTTVSKARETERFIVEHVDNETCRLRSVAHDLYVAGGSEEYDTNAILEAEADPNGSNCEFQVLMSNDED